MAEVTLSKYCDEAKELIRADSYDKAIAVCRHMLRHYPKYVRAYRLLGEACLEKGDYVEAANLFKRVLGTDMEDMVVYVGLGIVFEEQGALDEAVWQLERAFEISPGNGEIRKELQRLYGDRDGTAPPRLKLTPAALGRLYLREELFQRAIDEFRDVLEEDSDRPDVQIALAQSLWCSDQRQEAAKVCETILDKYPHCLKANLILGEILLRSGREDEGRTLLETAQAMDPENLVAQELFRDKSPLHPETVTVPRLDEEHLAQEVEDVISETSPPVGGSQPGAVVPMPSGDEEDVVPDWLRRLQEEEKESTLAAEGATSPPEPQEMPSWLQELAQERATESADEAEPAYQSPEAGEEGVPTWVSELGEAAGEELAPGEPAVPDETLALAEEQREAAPVQEPAEEEIEEAAAASEVSTDWLTQLREDVAGEEAEVEEAAPDSDITTDWLTQLREDVAGEKAEVEEGAPAPDLATDWLTLLGLEAAAEAAAARTEEPREAVPEEPAEEEGAPLAAASAEKETPDWLRGLGTKVAEDETAPEPVGEAETTEKPAEPAEVSESGRERLPGAEGLDFDEEAMERLRETMPDESASIDEIIAWMEESKALLSEEGGPESSIEEDLAAMSRDLAALEESVEEGETPTWLRELVPEAEADDLAILAEELQTPDEEAAVPISEEEIPTWLRELRPDATEGPPPSLEEEAEAPVPEEEVSTVVDESAATIEEAPAGPAQEEAPSWLLELRAEAAKKEAPVASEEPEVTLEEAPVSAPEEEEMPSWLRQLQAEAAREEPSELAEELEPAADEVAPPRPEEEEMPSWLRQLRAEATREKPPLEPEEPEAPLDEEPEPHVVEAELPSWLLELKAEVAREGIPSLSEEVEAGAEAQPAAPAEPEEVPSPAPEVEPEAELPRGVPAEVPEAPPEETPIRSPEEAEVPSWLRELRMQAEEGETDTLLQEAEAAAEEVPLPPLEEEDVPSWLRELRGEEPAAAPPAEAEPPTEVIAVEEPAAWPGDEAEPVGEEHGPPATPVEEPLAREEPLEETPQPERAVEDYLERLESNPRDHTTRLALARAYSVAGRLDQAAQQYEVMLSHGGLVDEVLVDLEATAEAAPEHLPTHELLADAYMRSGQLQKALDKYRWLRVKLAR